MNQIELDREYAFISVTVPDAPMKQVSSYIGVDRNASGQVKLTDYS
ncbi:MAG: hypothetical protein JRN61_05685 [Nitrososphaerota archaeon]|nr:hypothetical protein [Nitrososphaerota archaeon]